MTARVRRWVEGSLWPRRGFSGYAGAVLLWPLSAVWGTLVVARRAAYRLGVLPSREAGIPVVSVGNLRVGGSGKTPFALWLARRLEHAGLPAAIVLRGYKGRFSGPLVCGRAREAFFSAEEVGDEAVLLSKQFDGLVVVSRRRLDGVELARREGARVAVLDDGFQHLALRRACDLVLVGRGERGVLPAGPLREPRWVARRADALVVVRREGEPDPEPPPRARVPVFEASLEVRSLVESVSGRWVERPAGLLAGRSVATVGAVARPESLRAALLRWEVRVVEALEWEDHHAYTEADWREILYRSRAAELIVTTEKDLAKLEAFPFPRRKLYALRVHVHVPRERELLECVFRRIGQEEGRTWRSTPSCSKS
ncbi:MAG: tetraacyldisaccharide 4'-kinase [Candidatus Binatia bacterium]|nr:MAG: tetraacyldisaccharide 4'-kinase [Candidatus Binatia bacterium]